MSDQADRGSASGRGSSGRGRDKDDTLGGATDLWGLRHSSYFSSNDNEGSQAQASMQIHDAASLPSVAGTSVSFSSKQSRNTAGGTTASSASGPSQMVCTGLQPKATLAGWFGKTHRQLLSKDDYQSWHDGGPPHQLMFTAVFISPLTGEVWTSGRYGDSRYYQIRHDQHSGADVIWYTKKTFAEHGAAARAFDCFSYREHAQNTNLPQVRISEEQPYLNAEERTWRMPTLPIQVQSKIAEVQGRVTGRTIGASPTFHSVPATGTGITNAHTAQERYREEYRSSRSSYDRRDSNIKREEDMDTF